MSFDDDRDDDLPPSGPPLPPEDRLWRHPSELQSSEPSGAVRGRRRGNGGSRRGRWGLVAISCLAGATFTLGLVAAGGFFRTQIVEREPEPSDPSDGEEQSVSDAAARATPSVARLNARTDTGPRVGSAVVLGPAGHLVTSSRLVEGAIEVRISFADGTTFPAEVTGSDPVTSLTVLSVPSTSLASPRVASSPPEAGDMAVTVAGPAAPDGDSLVSAGVVSASGRPVGRSDGGYQDLVQTDHQPSPEAEGGAVVDSSGALLGISLPPAGGTGSSGWAVPVDVAIEVATDIVTTGRAHHAWLGIDVRDSTGMVPNQAFVSTTTLAAGTAAPEGVVVEAMDPEGPAADAGLLPGDLITEIDGTPVASMSDLLAILHRAEPGQKVALSYRRADQTVDDTVTMGQHP